MSTILMELMEQIRESGMEKVFNRYYSVYRAIVTGNEDPEERGRVQIKVPAIFGSNTILPTWAEPKDFRGASKGKGEFFVPDVGDTIFVEFEMGDGRFPIYSGGWYAKEELDPAFKYAEKKPVIKGYKSKYGHSVLFDETPGKEKLILTTKAGHYFILDDTKDKESIYLMHKSGSQIQVDPKGSIKALATKGGFINMSAETGEVTATSKDGAFASLTKDVKLMHSSGKHFATIDDNGITMNTSKDVLVNANSLGVSVGVVSLKDTTKAGLVVKGGKVALGSAAVELIDQVMKICDAFLNAPTLVTTGTGPSSPLMPPAKIQLTMVKTLLGTIKGTL